jgi:hypothetical protein
VREKRERGGGGQRTMEGEEARGQLMCVPSPPGPLLYTVRRGHQTPPLRRRRRPRGGARVAGGKGGGAKPSPTNPSPSPRRLGQAHGAPTNPYPIRGA